MLKVTEIQTNILLALGRYKFLTTSQIEVLKITDVTYARKILKELEDRKRPFVGRITFGIHPKLGKLENFFYLTKHGKKELIEGLGIEEVYLKAPKGKATLFFQDYHHRKYFINVQIAVYQWATRAELEIEFFHAYFDQIGNNRISGNAQILTKITFEVENYLLPDGIFLLHKNQERILYLVEMYNGKDTKRVLSQLEKHAKVLVAGSASDQYQVKKANRVICIFEEESAMRAVINRVRLDERFRNIKDFFFLKALDKLATVSFEAEWFNLVGEKTTLL